MAVAPVGPVGPPDGFGLILPPAPSGPELYVIQIHS